jgi:predicted metal-dependent phosphotriesterase family hydrolase
MWDFADDPEKVRDLLVRALLAFGIKKEDVKTMLVDNPAKLMWLD